MKPRQTELDYAIIAIAPALIMVLVGSLVLFLAALFYQGGYPERLTFILCSFVFAFVLIARISIEEGWQRASMFGVILGVVVLFAISRLAPGAVGIGAIFLGIIWWTTTRLVYDCTVIDQSKDASGSGLMQVIGWGDKEEVGAEPEKAQSRSVPEAVTQTTDDPAASSKKGFSWSLLNPTQNRFAPGAWVVYFSLAALPIFGLGQAFYGGTHRASKFYLFSLLVAYVTSALCLLVSTSFLGLRRYLRKRGMQMPAKMTVVWLGTGLATVLIVMAFVSIMPRPNAEYDLARLPLTEDAFRQAASRFSVGREGTNDPNSENRQGENREIQSQDGESQNGRQQGDTGESSESGSQEGEQSGGQEGESKEKSSSGESKEGSEKGEEGQGGSSDESGDSSSEDSREGEGKGSSEQQSEQANKGEQSEQRQNSERQQQRQQQGSREQTQSEQEQQSQQQQSGQQQSASPPPPSPPRPSPPMDWGGMFSALGSLLKLLIYAVVLALILYVAWRYRAEIAEAWQKFLAELRDFWNKLFARETRTDVEPAAAETPVDRGKPFSSFRNPFTDPAWRGRSVEEVIRYSFLAVEAWGREQGVTRLPDETPGEYARNLEARFAEVGQFARQLANFYSRIAYGDGKAPSGSEQVVRKLWQRMTAT
ncbi:MAG: DUF4129 domain-containing protein [Pirellulaceae bacterium]